VALGNTCGGLVNLNVERLNEQPDPASHRPRYSPKYLAVQISS
jgi:hypothetical protein